MSRHRENYDRASVAYRDARLDIAEAKALRGGAAEVIAEQVLETGTADATAFDVYKKAKELVEQKVGVAREAWEVYDRAYRVMTGQEKEEHPAVAAAGCEETKNSNQ